MAGTIRCFSKMNLNFLTINVTRQFIFNGARTVYTDTSLGLSDFRSTRDTFANKYRMGIDAFRQKMQSIVASEKEMVFTEDLKAILHLTEKSPAEIELLKKCLQKYNSQSSELRFSSFKFGPVVMRALHNLNEADVAKELFMDPSFDDFFNQQTTYMILLDLLHENGRYQDVCEVYDKVISKLGTVTSHPKLAVNIVGLSCYKLNTPESLEYGLKIWRDIVKRGSFPLRRFVAILSALALKQNQQHIALELAGSCKFRDYISIRCIRVMAFADMDRIDDVVMDFKNVLRKGQSDRNQYYKDTILKVEAAVDRLGLDSAAEIRDIIRVLKDTGYVYEMTLEDHIQLPIEAKKQIKNENHYRDQRWQDNESDYSDGARASRFERSHGDGNRRDRYSSG